MTAIDIERDGVSRHVELDGPEDGPPVLVLHGITASTATWEWLVPLVAPTHRMARLDFRGHGGSSRTPASTTPPGTSPTRSPSVRSCSTVPAPSSATRWGASPRSASPSPDPISSGHWCSRTRRWGPATRWRAATRCATRSG